MDTRDTREGLERRISIPSLQVRRALSGGMLISALLEDGKWATDTGLVPKKNGEAGGDACDGSGNDGLGGDNCNGSGMEAGCNRLVVVGR